ncbi:GNAT family N-acetyltransferase [Actibacterium lipolyticum]|uniref:Acetyltransferase (GNAT) family protein n=1 Tax=Actibacterium lipolyticum TaxID=1524263 RepID=A0A238KPK7_9RHOB|nr:GNAT family N-acetyltransferase [Actibacterium lipolyticum]SMX43956.1 Acetyltransferase (GNAT) family protein [Actibacterium lipolyticum]
MNHAVRDLDPTEVAQAAEIWHTGWHLAHSAHVPAELSALRTLDSFHQRIVAFGDAVRTAGPLGAPLGLCVTVADELYQIFVSQAAMGTGLAQKLLTDGESRIAAAGHAEAFLHCIPENSRARRFYTRADWRDCGNVIAQLETLNGHFPLEVTKYCKRVTAPA